MVFTLGLIVGLCIGSSAGIVIGANIILHFWQKH